MLILTYFSELLEEKLQEEELPNPRPKRGGFRYGINGDIVNNYVYTNQQRNLVGYAPLLSLAGRFRTGQHWTHSLPAPLDS
jgi:hypothetical protein